MRQLLVPVALLVVLLAGMGGAAWAWAHRGYPNAVYYRQVRFGGSTQPLVMEEWIDPRRRVIRRRQAWLGSAGDLVIRNGRAYMRGAGVPEGGTPVPAAVQRGLGYIFDGLAAGGYAGLGRQLLRHRIGPVERQRSGGRPALCFGVDGFDIDALSEVVCLDARTLVPLSERINLNQGTMADAQYGGSTRLPPDTLPPDFFDPFRTRPSPWDWLLGWLRDHLGRAGASCRASSSTAASSACR